MKILATNAIASIQDLGRFGSRNMGVGRNGVMDKWAYQAGNALLKNDLNTPALEITMGSMRLEFEQDVNFCLTGALYEAYLDDKRIASYWRINATAGQTLKLVRPLQGMYSYFCVQGGFDIDPVLGSYSTNAKAEFGGLNGRLLQQGDYLPLSGQLTGQLSGQLYGQSTNQPATPLPIIGVASIKPPTTKQSISKPANTKPATIIRVLKSSEYDYFTKAAQHDFVSQHWQLATSSNRMGYRFTSDNPLKLIEPLQMNSHGVDMGTIQVPPQGHPIVLMADAQTTGGYPKIATVIDADIGLLAQTRYGKSCQFSLVSVKSAIKARTARQRYITQIMDYANDH